MREAELQARLDRHLGYPYSRLWSDTMVLAGLGHSTVASALANGVPCREIWQVVWESLELPERDR